MSEGTPEGRSFNAPARIEALDVRSIVDTVREPLLVLDGDLCVQSANRSFYRTFRVSPQETEGRLLYGLGNGQWNISGLRTLLEEILPDDNAFDDLEIEHDFPDIGRKVMLINARRLGQDGAERILLAIEDVTERRRLEAERQEIETRFTSLVKNVQDHSIFTLDPEGWVTSWNVAAEHILGYTEAEALGRHFSFIFRPEDRGQGIPEAELRAAREQGRAEDERWHLRKSGARFWAQGIVIALHDTDGRLTGFSKVLRDMTDWKRAQEVMEANARRLAMAVDSAYVMAFEWDIPRNEVRCHHSHLGAVPETPEDRQSNLEEFCEAVHPDDRERFLANLHDTLAHPENGYRAEFRVCEPDGRIVWVAEHGYLECDEQGQPQRLIGLSRDITERKLEEERLRTARDAFRHLIEQSPFGIYAVDADFRLVQVSTGAQDTFRNVRPLIGRDFAEILRLIWPEPFASELIARFRHTLATGDPYHAPTTTARRSDGDESESYDWKIERLTLADGRPGVVCHFYDLSERQRYEEALRESESRFRTMAEGLPLMVWVHDVEGRQEFVNRTFCEFFGVSAEEAAGAGWKTLMHPDDAEAYASEFEECVQAQRPFHAEVRVQAADGKWHWLESWGRPRFSASGTFLGFVGTSADVTGRKRAEARLKESDRRKDEFLAILAHELRNPLAPIRISVDLLQALGGDPVASAEPLRIMDDQVSHLARLIDDLLDVSRISRGKIELRRERLELAEVIRAALDMSESRLGQDDRQFRVEVPSEPLPVDGDRVRLVQVFANLLNNAAKFTDAGGHIELGVTRAGDRVEIRVQDDGRGIPPEQLDRIFEMFSQAGSDQGAGLGIGLSLVRGLVDMHGGTVSAESQGPGCGAIFTVSLPLFPGAPVQSTADKATELGVPTGQCRVLVVDDNPDIVRGLQMLLTTLGAGVRVAHDGAEALRIFDDWPPTHVLMDIGMPGMDGYEAARRLRTDHADQAFRLIAVTGWGQEEDRQRALEAGFDEHLVKPVRLERLKEVLSA